MKRSFDVLWSCAAGIAFLGLMLEAVGAPDLPWLFWGVAGLFVLWGIANFLGSRFNRRFNFQAWWFLLPMMLCAGIAIFALIMARPTVPIDIPKMEFWLTILWASLGIGFVVLPCVMLFIRGMEFEMSPEMERTAARRQSRWSLRDPRQK